MKIGMLTVCRTCKNLTEEKRKVFGNIYTIQRCTTKTTCPYMDPGIEEIIIRIISQETRP